MSRMILLLAPLAALHARGPSAAQTNIIFILTAPLDQGDPPASPFHTDDIPLYQR
jgi:hypothetical protein